LAWNVLILVKIAPMEVKSQQGTFGNSYVSYVLIIDHRQFVVEETLAVKCHRGIYVIY